MTNRSLVRALASLALLTSATTALAMDEKDEEEGGTGGGSDGGSTEPPEEDHAWSATAYTNPSFGDDWGGGIFIRATVHGTPAAFSPSFHDELGASVSLSAFAKIAGDTHSIVSAQLKGLTISQRRSELTRKIFVGPMLVNSTRVDTDVVLQQQLVIEATPLSAVFFDERVNVWVGPVPVTFTASAVGEVGGYVEGRIDTLGVSAETGPFARVMLDASGAIGGEWCVPYVGPCIGASAGIEVELELVDIAAPAKVSVTSFGANTDDVTVDWTLDLGTRIDMLSGFLRLYAEAYIGGFGGRWPAVLWSWDGFHSAGTIARRRGSHCLVGDCFESGTGVQDGTGLDMNPDPAKAVHTESPDENPDLMTGTTQPTSETYDPSSTTFSVKR